VWVQAKANAAGGNWLENAVVCYMQAIRHGSAPARAMMPRILTLFSFHDSSGAVTQAIRKNSRQVCAQQFCNPTYHFPESLLTG